VRRNHAHRGSTRQNKVKQLGIVRNGLVVTNTVKSALRNQHFEVTVFTREATSIHHEGLVRASWVNAAPCSGWNDAWRGVTRAGDALVGILVWLLGCFSVQGEWCSVVVEVEVDYRDGDARPSGQ
jgi:hypothetical protein